MKSPFTGGEAILQKETRSMDFRKEAFDVIFQYYLCKDSNEKFTDENLDEVNTNQVYNQYRAKYGIPFPDEIKAIREQYGLAATKMAEILGLGINVYRNYESGEVPSVSNGRLIQMVKDPIEFRRLFEYSKNEFTKEESERINRKIDNAVENWNLIDNMIQDRMLGEKTPGLFNGYRVPDLDRINNMILYFAQKVEPFKTKMNKLLFYADFYNFKNTCYSISGLRYQAIQKGPVPKNYDYIFYNIIEKKIINVSYHDFGGNAPGEQFKAGTNAVFEEELFSTPELKAMECVATYFKNIPLSGTVKKSHEELAWIDNVDDFGLIDYTYGFDLKYPIIDNE